MLDVLIRWNRWGNALLDSGIERDVTSEISPFFNSPEIVVLMGPRRAGKTTVLFQIMDALEKSGIAREAMLHINFEEPALAPELSIQLLDDIYRTYREEVFPEGSVYLFLDEIQNVPQWERWVRARNENDNIKFFITGSSSQLMSRELATLLTGRHVAFTIFPLNFKEFLRFQSISIPAKRATLPTPIIQRALNHYLQWGGFPAVVLTQDERAKELLLKQYFDDVLFKDVALRHSIRDVVTLRNLAIHLLTQTAHIISFQRIAKLFGVSLDLASSYCHYLEEAFLVGFVPFYSEKVGIRLRNPHKVHAIDLGLRNMANLAYSADKGYITETAVFNALQRLPNDGIFYWKGQKEIDLVVRKGNTIQTLIQVTQEGLEKPVIHDREMSALIEARNYFPRAKRLVITDRVAKGLNINKELCEVIPLWKYLLTV